MTIVLIDYDSGNLHSAEKAFQRMAAEGGHGLVQVSADPDAVARAERGDFSARDLGRNL